MIGLDYLPLIVLLFTWAVLTPRTARSCSPPCEGWFLPGGGDVPANLPGVRFSRFYSALLREGENLIDVVEILPDGTERAVPVTITDESRVTAVATFARPLIAGATYRVIGRLDCTGDYLAEERSITFRAVGERPLPRTIGRIVVAEHSAEGFGSVPTASGSCTNLAQVVARHLTLRLSDDARPWRHALQIGFSNLSDGLFGFRDLPDDPMSHLPSQWHDALDTYAYAICRSTDPGIYGGFDQGEATVKASGALPGSDHAIAPTTATFSLVCGDPTNTTFVHPGDCSTGSAGLVALAFFAAIRARRRLLSASARGGARRARRPPPLCRCAARGATTTGST